MKKRFLSIFLSIAFPLVAIVAQPAGSKELTPSERTAFIESLSKGVKTVQCSFRQEKKSDLISETSVSEGVMYFRMPSSLRWEYTKPTPMAIVMHNGKITVADASGNQQNKNARVFRELTHLIASVVSGKEFESEKNFKTRYYANTTCYWIKMTPANRRLKAFFNHLEMTVDKQKMVAVKMVMNEKEGDLTTITFSNHKVNVAIDDKLFVTK